MNHSSGSDENDSEGEDENEDDIDAPNSMASNQKIGKKNGSNPSTSMKLFMWYFEQCDPKKCSGMALKRYGLL